MTPTRQPAPETAGWEHPTRLFRLTVWSRALTRGRSATGVGWSLGLSVAVTRSTRESRSDALIRTRTADEKFLACRAPLSYRASVRHTLADMGRILEDLDIALPIVGSAIGCSAAIAAVRNTSARIAIPPICCGSHRPGSVSRST
jgi:hypothetical protein